MKKLLKVVPDFLKGVGIGISAMIPGVSGGTFAVVTKCYDKIISAINELFKHFLRSLLILLPILVGMLVGIVGATFGLNFAFKKFLFATICLFAGLILGSVPDLRREIQGEKINFKRALIFTIALVIIVGLAILNFFIKAGTGFSAQSIFDERKWYLFIMLIPIGAIASSALVCPGISGSMLLLVLGFYSPILNELHNLFLFNSSFFSSFLIILCFGIGVIIGFFLISKLMGFLLNKHRVSTFYMILGFIVGSIPSLFLNYDIWAGNSDYIGILNQPLEIVFGLLLFFGGAIFVYFVLNKVRQKKELNNAEK